VKSFAYQAPTTIAEAVALLAEKNGRARPLAGGTDLLVQMRLKLHDLDLVVDVKKIPELNQISFDSNDGLTVGAAVSCARLYETPEVVANYPGLVDAASIIGGMAIQGRATLGGNLCNAAPSGDSISAMIVLGATCTVAGPQGTRTVPVEDFCTGPGKTVLEPGEILVSIHLPLPQPNSGARYLRFTPRQEMDIAIAGAGASVVLNDDLAEIAEARIALAAVAPTPLLVEAAAASLLGKTPSEEVFVEAAKLAQEAAKPITDVRGTAAQRRHLVGVLVKRALRGAVARAKGESINE
jgi:CO/xanthine dehydrogenase FAD-binding subunit